MSIKRSDLQGRGEKEIDRRNMSCDRRYPPPNRTGPDLKLAKLGFKAPKNISNFSSITLGCQFLICCFRQ